MTQGIGPNFPYDPILNPTGYKPNEERKITPNYALPGGATPGLAASAAAGLKAAQAAAQTPQVGALIATPPSTTPVNPYANNPYTNPATREKGRAEFTASLQPQILKATNAVTSSVSPYMTGNIGASLLRNVQQPATEALAGWETEQNKLGQEITLKGQEWEAGAPEREKAELTSQANLLLPFVGKGNTQVDTQYNTIMAKLMTDTRGSSGGTPSGINYVTTLPSDLQKKIYDQYSTDITRIESEADTHAAKIASLEDTLLNKMNWAPDNLEKIKAIFDRLDSLSNQVKGGGATENEIKEYIALVPALVNIANKQSAKDRTYLADLMAMW